MATPLDSPASHACPHCGTLIVVESAVPGTTVQCPHCQMQFPVAQSHPIAPAVVPVDVEQLTRPPARRKRRVTPSRTERGRWHDEDDDDGRPRRSSKKIWILVLSLGGGFLLLCGLGCGGLLFWMVKMFRDLPAVQASADAFLNDLAGQRPDEAYARTTKAFQSKQSLEQFRTWVRQYPALTTHSSRSYTGVNMYQQPGVTQGIVKATVLGPHNSLSFTLILVKEDEQWKIDSITVP